MASSRPARTRSAKPRTELIVVGASAGGVAALLALLAPLPASFTLPIVAVLHLLPRRESQLGNVLAQRLALPVSEAQDKAPIQPGTVYVASADYHLLVERDRTFSFSSEPPVSFARPSIDMTMVSAAEAFGTQVTGVLLTGANMDGAKGMAAIKAAGGLTIVQQPEEAEVRTMPDAAIALQAPDHVLPLLEIQQLLLKLAGARLAGAHQ